MGGAAVAGGEGGLAGEQQQQSWAHHPAAVDVAVAVVLLQLINLICLSRIIGF